MKSLHYIAFALLVIGGLNWLLVGLFQWDVGAVLGGMDAWLSRVVYILVGLAAVYELVAHKSNCRACGMMGGKMDGRPQAGPSSRSEMSQESMGGDEMQG